MCWDAYFKSGFHPDGACFGNRKEQERKTFHEVYLGSYALVTRRKKCPSKGHSVVPEATL